MNPKDNSIEEENLVQRLSTLQFNTLKWAYMKLENAIADEDVTTNLFADRQLKAAEIEKLIRQEVLKGKIRQLESLRDWNSPGGANLTDQEINSRLTALQNELDSLKGE